MVLAYIVGEVVDPYIRRCAGRCIKRGSQCIEVTAAEHVGFADNARRDGDGVDCGVELRVARCEKEFLETAAARAGDVGA